MNIMGELKRRNVFRVALLYLVTSWLIVQVAETVLPLFDVPDSFLRGIILLLAVGLVPALVFSWAFELTPDGLRREPEAEGTPETRQRTAARLNWATLTVVVLAIAVVVADRVMPEPAPTTPSVQADAAGAGALESANMEQDRTSIAVLPFANLSPDPAQAFFADGITEDILTRLAGLRDLRVISRTSIMRYKGSGKSLPAIAEELGVNHILEGSVRRSGDQVRITGQLIRAADDAHLWAESYDRELDDIFAVQTEIAHSIVAALELQLSADERGQIARNGTDDAKAYEQYLRGRAQLNRSYSNPDELRSLMNAAGARYRAALEHDPDYAEAWAGLAQVALGQLGYNIEGDEAHYQEAVENARRAIALAPQSIAGYIQLGRAYLWRGLGDAAAEQFRLAAGIKRDSVELLAARAAIFSRTGRLPEALQMLERAVRLEPADANLRDDLGKTAARLGALERAREAFNAAWGRITPHEARRTCMLSNVALQAGQFESAQDLSERGDRLEPDSPFQAACTLWMLLVTRDLDAAGVIFQRHRAFFEQRQPVLAATLRARTQPGADIEAVIEHAAWRLRTKMPRKWGSNLEYGLAEIELLRGNHEQALARLANAVQLGWRQYRELDLDILWDPVRDDPRFVALAEKVDQDLAAQRTELALGTGAAAMPGTTVRRDSP